MRKEGMARGFNWLIAVIFVIAALPLTAYGSQACRSALFLGRIAGVMENRDKFDAEWKKWFAKQVDPDNADIGPRDEDDSKYPRNMRRLTRWQFFNRKMMPEVRELMTAARPEFFKDQILPDPVELTLGMIKVYRSKKVPREQWVLPGLAFRNRMTGEYKAFSYLELHRNWPTDYEVAGNKLPDHFFNRALSQGVMIFEYKTLIHKYFDVHITFHDLNHLASMLHPPYLAMIREFMGKAFATIDRSSRPDQVAEAIFGLTGSYYHFEEFWYVQSDKTEKLSEILSYFQDAETGTPAHLVEIPPPGANPLKLKLITPIRTQRQVLTMLDKIVDFYENDVTLLGGALADQFSFRAMSYRGGTGHMNSYNLLRTFLFSDGVEPERANNIFSNMVVPLIQRSRNYIEHSRGVLSGYVERQN